MTLLNLLIIIAIKPLALLLVARWQLNGNSNASASSRHLCLALIILLLPLLSLADPWLLHLLPNLPLSISPAIDNWLAQPVNHWLQASSSQYLLGIYLIGCLWILFYLGLGVFSLWRREQESQPQPELQQLVDQLCHTLRLKRRVQLRSSTQIDTPQVWGLFHSTIFIPASMIDWPKQQLQLVLLHELGHVARYDWPLRIISHCICALYWFLPPIWWLARAQENMCERACDDWVLADKDQDSDYAQLLLTLTQSLRQQPLPGVAINGGSAHYQRILALLDRYSDRDKIDRRELLRASLLCGLCVIPLSLLQASIQKPSDIYSLEYQHIHSLPLSFFTPSASRAVSNGTDTGINQRPPQLQRLSALPSPRLPINLRPPLEELLVIEPMEIPQEASSRLRESNQSQLTQSAKVQAEQQAQEISVEGYLPIHSVTPHYPARALRRGIEGRVRVEFAIDINGKAYAPQIIDAQPRGVFEQTVLQALSESRFRPYKINHRAITITGIREDFIFKLRAPAESNPTTPPPVSFADATENPQSHRHRQP